MIELQFVVILRHLTRGPHLGGTEDEKRTAEWVADTWRRQGMDEVHLTPYQVLLSYPDASKPNKVLQTCH